MPVQLPKEQLQSHFIDLDRVFGNYKLHELMKELETIKGHLFNRSYPHSETSKEHDNTLHVFEQMEDLIQTGFSFHSEYQKKLLEMYDAFEKLRFTKS